MTAWLQKILLQEKWLDSLFKAEIYINNFRFRIFSVSFKFSSFNSSSVTKVEFQDFGRLIIFLWNALAFFHRLSFFFRDATKKWGRILYSRPNLAWFNSWDYFSKNSEQWLKIKEIRTQMSEISVRSNFEIISNISNTNVGYQNVRYQNVRNRSIISSIV